MLDGQHGAQFLSLPWNLYAPNPIGQMRAHGVPVHALDRIEISSDDDVILHFDNGALPIQSRGNARELIGFLDENKIGGLQHAFVQLMPTGERHDPVLMPAKQYLYPKPA